MIAAHTQDLLACWVTVLSLPVLMYVDCLMQEGHFRLMFVCLFVFFPVSVFEEVKNLTVTRHRILINRKHVPVKKQQCRAGEQTSLLIFQEIASIFSVQCTRDCIHKCWNDAHPVLKQWPLPLLLYCFTVIGEDKIVRGTLPDKKKHKTKQAPPPPRPQKRGWTVLRLKASELLRFSLAMILG